MSTTDQLNELQDHHNPSTPGSGQHTRLWAADVVTVNPDGTVDIQPVHSRATKVQVPTPGWYSPTVGDRVLASDLNGDRKVPVVHGPLSAVAVQAAARLLGFYGTTPAAQPVLSYSRTGETAQVAAIRQALAAVGLIKDSTTP